MGVCGWRYAAGDQDEMVLIAENTGGEDLRARVAETLASVTRLRGAVEFAAPGSLPNDGKVIADERTYS